MCQLFEVQVLVNVCYRKTTIPFLRLTTLCCWLLRIKRKKRKSINVELLGFIQQEYVLVWNFKMKAGQILLRIQVIFDFLSPYSVEVMAAEDESIDQAVAARRERLRALRAAQELLNTPDEDAVQVGDKKNNENETNEET